MRHGSYLILRLEEDPDEEVEEVVTAPTVAAVYVINSVLNLKRKAEVVISDLVEEGLIMVYFRSPKELKISSA